MHNSHAIPARLALAVLLAVAWRAIACAAPTVYFGGPDESKLSLAAASAQRAAFLGSLSSYGVEDLEGLAGQANPTLDFSPTGVAASTGFSNGVFSQPVYAVSGTCFLWDSDGADDWLQFSEPITGFGSYIVQSGDGASAPPSSRPPNVLTFHLENTQLGTTKDVVVQSLGPDWPFYNVVFVGVTDAEPFDRISFHESVDFDGLLWDDLIVGHVAKTPSADFNNDQLVNAADLELWRDSFGTVEAPSMLFGDADGDHDADGNDFIAWQRQLNAASPTTLAFGTPAAHNVPEPRAIVLALFVSVIVLHGGARGARIRPFYAR